MSDDSPRELCVLRLSALGDVCHALPVVRTLQDAWPAARFTWIIGEQFPGRLVAAQGKAGEIEKGMVQVPGP